MKNALIMVFVAAAGAMFNYYAATLMIWVGHVCGTFEDPD
jgi:hypothetical protein